MPRWHTVEVNLTSQEYEQLSELSKARKLPLPILLKEAALTLKNPKKIRYTGEQLRKIYREAHSRGHIWTEHELRDQGLPLYWSESWFREQRARGLSLNQIALICGGNVHSVRSHTSLYHDLPDYRKLKPAQVTDIQKRLQQGESRADLAVNLKLSKTTLSKYAEGVPSKHDLAFKRRAETVGCWPATTKQIAAAIFEGNLNKTVGWTTSMVKSGRLIRLSPGIFDLNRNRSEGKNLQSKAPT